MQSRQAARGGENRTEPKHVNHAGTAMLEEMMEKAVSPMNWEAALYAVERNNGAPGPDGMRAKQLRAHLEKNGRTIKERLLEGSYRPGAARRKEIAKPDGGTRPLSIPNVQDRFVQHLLLGVMQPIFEEQFSESSYGFDSAALRPSGAPASHLSRCARLARCGARKTP